MKLIGVLAGLSLLACGGRYADVSVAVDAGSDGLLGDDIAEAGPRDSGRDSAPSGPCPAERPREGGECRREGLECEYGASEYPSCDDVFECAARRWVRTSFGVSCPSGPNDPSCPPTFQSVPRNQTCGPQGLTCHYDLGQCYCGVSFGPPMPYDGGPQDFPWTCDDPAPGCPQPRPRLGSACDGRVPVCVYQQCDYGQACQDGVWQAELMGCGG